MVRTGDRCVRIGGGKSSSKKGGGGASSTSSSSTPKSKASSSKKNSSIGGNPVCPRETPEWQKPITNFFQRKEFGESSNHINEEKNKAQTSESTVSNNKNLGCESDNNVNGTSTDEKHTAIELENSPTKEKSQNHDARSESNSNNKLDDAKPSTSSASVESSSYKNIECKGENQDNCKTPTSEKKRKSSINILTPKRIQSHS